MAKCEKHSGHIDIYKHKVHTDCYLQVQQSFKFPVIEEKNENKKKIYIKTIKIINNRAFFARQIQWKYPRLRNQCHVHGQHYLQNCTETYRCSLLVLFTLERSKTHFRLLTWPPAMEKTKTHTLVYSCTHTGAHKHTHARTHTHTHSYMRTHACNKTKPSPPLGDTALGLSQHLALPVSILLYVIIGGGCTIKQARVQGLALLASGKDSWQRAQSHFLFLLLTFLFL